MPGFANRLTTALAAAVALILLCPRARADDDVLLRALQTELDRAMNDLRLESLAKPYFIQYNVADVKGFSLEASFGSLTSDEPVRYRRLQTQVRVGDYELDNTNFSEGGNPFAFMMGGGGSGAGLPIENDEIALRQAIWRATDGVYKSVVEALTKKKEYIKTKNIADKPADFARQEPSTQLDPVRWVKLERAKWREPAQRLSAVFRDVPGILDASVTVRALQGYDYVVNSEGTTLRLYDSIFWIEARASAQADDGELLSDSVNFRVRRPDQLPDPGKAMAEIRALAERLVAAARAPTLESYTGPVLFTGRGACQLFADVLAPGLGGGQKPLGAAGMSPFGQMEPPDLEKKVGKRILPRSFDVVDDPTPETVTGVPAAGHYRFDDEGVPAQPIVVVENGVLKNQLMSRNPSKQFDRSTGHGRTIGGMASDGKGKIGCLTVTCSEGVPDDKLKDLLIERCKEEDLEYGLIVRSLVGDSIDTSNPMAAMRRLRRMMQGGRGGGVSSTPGDVVKVYVEDGRTEPVRGLEFADLSLKSLKDIVAAGQTPQVYNYYKLGFMGATPPSTIAAPAVLLEELDLNKSDVEHDKPPILSGPFARAGK